MNLICRKYAVVDPRICGSLMFIVHMLCRIECVVIFPHFYESEFNVYTSALALFVMIIISFYSLQINEGYLIILLSVWLQNFDCWPSNHQQ